MGSATDLELMGNARLLLLTTLCFYLSRLLFSSICFIIYIYNKVLKENQYVCSFCNHHFRMGSEKYFSLLLDNNHYEEFYQNIISNDPLLFQGKKRYSEQLEITKKKTLII